MTMNECYHNWIVDLTQMLRKTRYCTDVSRNKISDTEYYITFDAYQVRGDLVHRVLLIVNFKRMEVGIHVDLAFGGAIDVYIDLQDTYDPYRYLEKHHIVSSNYQEIEL